MLQFWKNCDTLVEFVTVFMFRFLLSRLLHAPVSVKFLQRSNVGEWEILMKFAVLVVQSEVEECLVRCVATPGGRQTSTGINSHCTVCLSLALSAFHCSSCRIGWMDHWIVPTLPYSVLELARWIWLVSFYDLDLLTHFHQLDEDEHLGYLMILANFRPDHQHWSR